MVRGILLTSNLPQLQNLIKRDPINYKEEFLQQWNHYKSIRKIFQVSPDEQQAQRFREVLTFISQVLMVLSGCGLILLNFHLQVSPCYPSETAGLPDEIASLLMESFGMLDADMRKSLISNLIMLRNKEVIESIE